MSPETPPTPLHHRILEGAAVVSTLVCVWLTGRESVWCWPVGILGAALYLVVFARARLYSDVLLQVYFLVTSAWGWYAWTRDGTSGEGPLVVTTLGGWQALGWAVVAAVGVASLGTFMRRRTRAAFPYLDAVIAVLSVVAQVLLTAKKLESWVLWIGVDALAVWVYARRSLYASAALYAVLLVLAAQGLWSWWGSLGVAP